MTDDIKSAVMEAVKEIAIVKGEDPWVAMQAADEVLTGARGTGQALSEQYEVNKAEQAKREQQREQQNRQRIPERVDP